jgi:hypothetical protein
MQENVNSESFEEAAERQSNFLILRSLEHKLKPSAFAQLLTEVSP